VRKEIGVHHLGVKAEYPSALLLEGFNFHVVEHIDIIEDLPNPSADQEWRGRRSTMILT
jgi:hypothetical protein